MSDHAQGGNDTFTGGGPFPPPALPGVGSNVDNFFYGDAGGNISGHSHGGDDSFTASNFLGHNHFYGDGGGDMSGHASGGNDTFTVSSPNNLFNIFYGDAGSNMSDHAQGGNDTFNDSVVNEPSGRSASAARSTAMLVGICPTMLTAVTITSPQRACTETISSMVMPEVPWGTRQLAEMIPMSAATPLTISASPW